jgi:UDP-N-acetylmuramoyl-tripeptide--D-alanyl-D-alanine ligase
MKNTFKSLIVKILTWEAVMVLKKYKPKIVAITGSVGKTSAKDAIYTVLSGSFPTRRSEKSFNSEVGVPLTILGCPNGWSNPFIWLGNIVEGFLLFALPHKYPEWLVLEVGADKPGDIESVSAWLKPDIAVITRFGDVPVHVEFFPSIEDLVREKSFLAQELKPDGVFVYNHDDNRIRNFSETIHNRKVSFGFEPGADVYGSHESVTYGLYENSELEFPTGITMKVNYHGSSIPIALYGALGRQHMYPMLAAFAVGASQNINPIKINEALSTHIPPKGRMRLIPGIKDTLLIDDTYNSSPVAVYEAFNSIVQLQTTGMKIAVLGDMLELGQYSIDEHKRVGEAAAKTVDILVTVGVRSRATADAAQDAGMSEKNILQFEKSTEAGQYLKTIIQQGDIIFVKGSQSIRMERIVAELMRHPENKAKLLVRQDKQWLAKK